MKMISCVPAYDGNPEQRTTTYTFTEKDLCSFVRLIFEDYMRTIHDPSIEDDVDWYYENKMEDRIEYTYDNMKRLLAIYGIDK